MGVFTFLWNCIFGFIELLNRVPIVSNFSALDFILCTLLFSFVLSIVLRKKGD